MCYLKNDNPLRKNTNKRAIFQRCLRKSEREYLRVSDAKIRHSPGACIIRDN